MSATDDLNFFFLRLNARAELRTRNRPPGRTLLSFSRIEWARQLEASYSSTIPRVVSHPCIDTYHLSNAQMLQVQHLSVKQDAHSHIDQDIEMENVAVSFSVIPSNSHYLWTCY